MDDGAPQIRAIVGYPLWGGAVILSKQDTVSLEDAEQYHLLGFVVLIDPADEDAFYAWQRWRTSHWSQW